jgi:8-oxo-dGTP pyrophosphatase MutT (NUDIX family)
MNDMQNRVIESAMSLLNRPRVQIAEAGLTPAAVLVPVVFRSDTPHFIFTKRTMTVAHHKGQISFPGGAAELCDGGPPDTALRETNEEIGLVPECVRVLGCMDDLVTLTSFLVTPVVGIVDEHAAFTPNTKEVAEIFELPINAFLDPSLHRTEPFEYKDSRRTVHYYEIGSRTVWGVTAEIVCRITSVFK